MSKELQWIMVYALLGAIATALWYLAATYIICWSFGLAFQLKYTIGLWVLSTVLAPPSIKKTKKIIKKTKKMK